MTRRVLILAGGTGGHIYPALAVADCLRGAGVDLAWLGSLNGLEGRVVPAHGIPMVRIPVTGLRGRGVLGWLAAPWRVVLATYRAIVAVLDVKPGVVLGMGGFVSGPGGVAAWLCRRPLVIHEQNAIPGLTNKLLSRLATRVLEAYPRSFELARQAIATGNPVRADIAALPAPRERLGGRRGLRVLVFGGSRGARRLNVVLPLALGLLALPGLEVRHQCGRDDVATTQAAYAAQGVAAQVEAFIEDMAGAYAWADLVICRAGAITVAELAAAGAASILVPFPYAVDDHQTANARYLADAGAARLVQERDLEPAALAAVITELAHDRQTLVAMAERARDLARPDAATTVAGHCLELLDA
ncbi:MAG: undecaprenyldiphospho-muramoylpentapeptide beta-N-acetylglucosaminyltransferase [Gammaproteobacteria bacterium]|nr:undecaprenyldiphospho-muramoylpentapeptide beta-N-acetylglucosaminyltransferase [Gammaproteobacteria bacterium]MBI5618534.1 undecaprenyldiphospho-muramoylpentapeptide beta-N-acetylglucosaminyltransferase [Gammaproteobacteria bacterium]